MKILSPIFSFYKSFILWSFGLNVLLIILGFSIIPLIIAKLISVIFLFYIINETEARKKLIFYKNLGISPLKLFGILYLIDLSLSIPFHLIIQEFI